MNTDEVSISKKLKSENRDWKCYNCHKKVGAYEYRLKVEDTTVRYSPVYIWMCSLECAELWILKI